MSASVVFLDPDAIEKQHTELGPGSLVSHAVGLRAVGQAGKTGVQPRGTRNGASHVLGRLGGSVC